MQPLADRSGVTFPATALVAAGTRASRAAVAAIGGAGAIAGGLLAAQGVSVAVVATAVVAGAVVVAFAVAGTGLARAGAVSIEQVERRARLVALLKFAATMRDLRAVVLFRRQLADEAPRTAPLVRLRGASRFPVWRRTWQGALRWPNVRWARFVAMGAAAWLATLGAADGPGELGAIAALALFIMGVEATDALAQDADRPTFRLQLPVEDGQLWLRHIAPAATLVAIALVPGWVVVVVLAGSQALAAGAIIVPSAIAAATGAAWAVVRDPLPPSVEMSDPTGLSGGTRLVLPVAWAGAAPLGYLMARSSEGAAALGSAATMAVVAAIGGLVWLRLPHPLFTPPGAGE